MLLKLAWRNIWRNKRRSLITAASVSFALFFAILMRSMQLGTYENVYDSVINSSTGYIQVHQEGYWDEPTLEKSMERDESLLTKVTGTQGVQAAVPRLESFSLLSTGNDTKGAMVMGIDPEAEHAHFELKERIVAGTFFSTSDRSLVLSQGLADFFAAGVGDTLVMIGQGYHGVSANGKYPVAGIVKLSSPELNQRLAYLPLPEAQQLYGAYGRLTSLVIIPENNREFEEVAASLSKKLDTARYEVMTWREMLPELIQTLEADSAGGVVILFILYLVISFGAFGTILMLTAERLPEFGILISIGMARGKIALVTFLEILFLSFLGSLAAWVFAMPIAWYFHENPVQLTGRMDEAMQEYGMEPIMPFSVDLSIPMTHTTGVLIITMILSLYAVWKILKLNPVTAVRT